MQHDHIVIKGARENNLKNINLTIPRDKLIVFTGVSGSGKTSLAFDTIYADGQRRYMESLSSYARQFLGLMDKPDGDSIDGLSPAISIDQKTTSKNPRSTVGTVTEIYDYLRLLYARIGVPHCPVCGREIRQQAVDQIVDRILSFPEGSRVQILAPIVRGRKGLYVKELDAARRSGFTRVRIDGNMFDLEEEISLDKNKKHTIEIVVDRLVVKPEIRSRLADSIETASAKTGGLVNVLNGEEELQFSQNYSCPDHDISVEEQTPRMFSFNNPFGACPTCSGLGFLMRVDPKLVLFNPELTIAEGGIKANGWYISDGNNMAGMYYKGLAKHYNFTLDTPIKDLTEKQIQVILYGSGIEKIRFERNMNGYQSVYEAVFEGVIPNLERRFRETGSAWVRDDIQNVMSDSPCPDCGGERLKAESLAVTIAGVNIADFTKMSIDQALRFLDALQLSEKESAIAERIVKEIRSRLGFLKNVGLSYLTLSRSAGSLSGGESQRIRLATQIGSSLMGVLYILDEPSIGLHQRDNSKLIATLKNLRDMGNTVVVVEHDEETMTSCDHIVDVGPGAGVHGGEIVFSGTPEEILFCEKSLTGAYLSGKKQIPLPSVRRKKKGSLKIVGARENNLKSIDVTIPLGVMTCVTGVSGSGKSSLVNEILYKTLASKLNGAKTHPGKCDRIEGIDQLDKVIAIDQAPIGRTPRSNPATYTGVFTEIRNLFAATNEAKARGYASGRFSFNIKGGRCEACEGDGIIRNEMHFLPDVNVPCDVCKGKRYNRETLEVRYKDKNIYDVLDMTVEEALVFFAPMPRIASKLQTLMDVGLGYIKLGQSATTLSGGAAQRVKLATELSKKQTGKTIYILDEPTTGLHSDDVRRLVEVLERLVESGNTVVVIEHNLDMIKVADHIIDLGPEGGDGGGTILVCGTPEEVSRCQESFTGLYLKEKLTRPIPLAGKGK